jgi:hypothetical protein
LRFSSNHSLKACLIDNTIKRNPKGFKKKTKKGKCMHVLDSSFSRDVWVCDFFVLYFTILCYIQNCESQENVFFEIIFGWFRKKKKRKKKKERRKKKRQIHACVGFEFFEARLDLRFSCIIFYYYLLYSKLRIPKNIFFEIMFGWFIKLKQNWKKKNWIKLE